MEKYQRKEIARLKELLGKHSTYVKERMADNRKLAKPYRIDAQGFDRGLSMEDEYLAFLMASRGIRRGHAEAIAMPDLADQPDRFDTEAPTGSFKFRNVPMDGKGFGRMMTRLKKYKMFITVERCHNGDASGYAVT